MTHIGRRAIALEYLHAGDGRPYRHAFTTAAQLEGNPDGSLSIRSSSERRLWKKFLTAGGNGGRLTLTPFLENPPMRKRSHKVSRSSSSSRAKARNRGAPRKTKRPPPPGFSSWKAWGAHMKRLRSGSSSSSSARRGSTGGSMAKRKGGGKKRKSSGRRSPRRHSINPPKFAGVIRQAPRFAMHVALMSVAAVAGKIVARKLRGGVFRQQPGTLIGSLAEAGIGIAGGLGISMFSPVAGEGFAIGAVSAPIETAVQQRQIKGISDALGDDGYFVGGNSGVGLISAFPDDYSNVVGDDDVSGYVAGGGNGAGGRGGSDIVAGYLRDLDAA